MTAYINLNSMNVALETSVRRGVRSQRVQFGDGYSQILTDGINSQSEVWECTTGPLDLEDAYGIESYMYRQAGRAFLWTPPDATKTFTAQFEDGELDLGYRDISTLTLDGQSRPGNYTANLATGLLTSVDIANLTDVDVTLTLNARNYILEQGWQFSYISPVIAQLSFALKQVYV